MKKNKLILIFSAALILSLAAEIFVFNSSFFIPKILSLDVTEVRLDDVVCDGGVSLGSEQISAVSSGEIKISLNSDARYLRLYSEGYSRLSTATILTNNYVKQFYFSPDEPASTVFKVNAKAGETLTLKFGNECSGLKINRITLNEGRDFHFSILRFLYVFIPICLISDIFLLKLPGQIFDYKNKIHNRAILILMIFLLSISALISQVGDSISGEMFHKYPLEGDYSNYGNYIQQADSFLKGQIELNLDIPDYLFELENPYSPSQHRLSYRDELWDKAFYNGKAQSYFGVAPVLLIYVPICFLTGYMPSDIFTCTVMAMGAIVFLLLLIREIVIRFEIKVTVVTLLFGMTAAVCGGMIFLLQASANFYTVAVISGLCFLLGFMYFAFRASRCNKYPKRYILFVLSGICYILIVASRPNMALYILGILPIFIAVLLDKDTPLNCRLLSAVYFAIPLLLGGVGIMWYNSVRFSSPFDFGNNYQLTVTDVSSKKLKPNFLEYSLYHYLISPPEIIERFPFIKLPVNRLDDYKGEWIYIGQSMGAIWYGAPIASIFAPFIGKGTLSKSFFYFLTIVTALFIAFADFCLAGAHVRYTADVIPMLMLVGVCALFEISATKLRKVVTPIVQISFFLTILLSVCFVFDNETHNMIHNQPGIFSLFSNPIIW